ncbi:MAG: cytochrome c biogenesis protein CcsA [Cyanobacteria bacterium J06558_2]
MKLIKFIVGVILGISILIIPVSQFQASPLEPLQNLAVQLDGRKKPLDTVARETVTQIHGRANYTALDSEKLDYLSTYLSLWFNNRDWNQEEFILFSYRPLKESLGLESDRKYFSFEELVQSDLGRVIKSAKDKQANKVDLNRDEQEALTLEERLALVIATVDQSLLPLIPHPMELKGTWLSVNDAEQYYTPKQVALIQADYQLLRQTYRQDAQNQIALGTAAAKLTTHLAQLSPYVYPDASILFREVKFYSRHPFAKAWMLYALAFILMLLVSLFNLNFYWGAMGVFITGLLVHSYGFLERMQIAGRPPVTNMYESVIWVGFGISAIALLFELIYRAKYYLLAAAPLSVVCLLLADSLPAILDPSIKPLVPVLRDNFWLSVHVPTIALSYASFALAFGLGHIILANYLFTPNAKQRIRSLSQWNYGTLQVGVFLLTTGIILGGIWAHYSWGRFWGWDPKETWALIALMCYIVPLHGRLVGWLRDFGMAITSVLSFNGVLMAWYGVNFVLGTGLHSYGFATGGSSALIAGFIGLDLLFVLIVACKPLLSSNKLKQVKTSDAVVEQKFNLLKEQ